MKISRKIFTAIITLVAIIASMLIAQHVDNENSDENVENENSYAPVQCVIIMTNMTVRAMVP